MGKELLIITWAPLTTAMSSKTLTPTLLMVSPYLHSWNSPLRFPMKPHTSGTELCTARGIEECAGGRKWLESQRRVSGPSQTEPCERASTCFTLPCDFSVIHVILTKMEMAVILEDIFLQYFLNFLIKAQFNSQHCVYIGKAHNPLSFVSTGLSCFVSAGLCFKASSAGCLLLKKIGSAWVVKVWLQKARKVCLTCSRLGEWHINKQNNQ